MTDLREDGGLAVARGWKHEELAGAAIGAAGGVVGGRQLGGSDELASELKWIRLSPTTTPKYNTNSTFG